MNSVSLHDFIRGLPKAELHLHIEGSLEPEMMFALAQRNGVKLPYASVDEVRAAYDAALGKRDVRLNSLAEKTQDAAVKVQEASNSAVQAADTASKAAEKGNEAEERQTP